MRIRRPTYANVVSTLALFIALGGASYAAVALPRNSVGTRQLRDRAVTQSKLASPVSAARARVNGPFKLGDGKLTCAAAPGACSAVVPPRPVHVASVAVAVPRNSRVLLLVSTDLYRPPPSPPEAASVSLYLGIPATKTAPRLLEGQRDVLFDSGHENEHVSFWATEDVPSGRQTFTLEETDSGSDIYMSGTELVAIPLPAG